MAFEYCKTGGRRFHDFMYFRRYTRKGDEAFYFGLISPVGSGIERWMPVRALKQTAMMYARSTAYEIGLVNKSK